MTYDRVQGRSSTGSSGAGLGEQACACRLQQGASTALLARLGTALDIASGLANGVSGHGDAAEGQCWAGFDLAALVRALAGPGLAPHQPVLARPLPPGGSSPRWPVIGSGSGHASRLDARVEVQGRQGVWGEYEQGRQFARGSFGEVWRAVRRRPSRRTQRGNAAQGPASAAEAGRPAGGDAGREEGSDAGFEQSAEQGFVLKRVLGGRGSEAWRSGRREEYFGRLFWPAQARAAVDDSRSGAGHLVRYVESLEVLNLCTCVVGSIVVLLQEWTLERLLAPMQSLASGLYAQHALNKVIRSAEKCLATRTSLTPALLLARADGRQPLAGVPRRGTVPARAHVRAHGPPGCWRGGPGGTPPARQRRRSLGNPAAQRVVVAAAAGSRGASVGRPAPHSMPS